GVGKTRLALEVAAELTNATGRPDEAPSRAVFVPLSDLRDGTRLFEAILEALAVVAEPARDPVKQLAAALAAQPGTLLILDNFEQLIEEGALRVRALLAQTPEVKLLVTSRQKLLL